MKKSPFLLTALAAGSVLGVGLTVQMWLLQQRPSLQDPLGPAGLAIVAVGGGIVVWLLRERRGPAAWIGLAGFFAVVGVLVGEHGTHGLWMLLSVLMIVLGAVQAKPNLALLGVFLLVGAFWIHSLMWAVNPQPHGLFTDAGFVLLLSGGLIVNAVYVYRASGRIPRVTQLFTAEPTPAVDVNVSAPLEISAGQPLPVQFDIVNAARAQIVATKILEIAPREAQIVELPAGTHVESDGTVTLDSCLLAPLEVRTLRFRMQLPLPGIFELAPRLIVTDHVGRPALIRPRPVRLVVMSSTVFGFRKEATRRAFNHLVGAFIDDYHVDRMNPDEAGWRSLARIAKETGIGKSHVYGPAGGYGPAIAEALERGLMEIRSFEGERGRGGTVLRARVRHDNEVVHRYIEELVLRGRHGNTTSAAG